MDCSRCEVMSATALSGPEDSISQLSGSYVLSTPSSRLFPKSVGFIWMNHLGLGTQQSFIYSLPSYEALQGCWKQLVTHSQEAEAMKTRCDQLHFCTCAVRDPNQGTVPLTVVGLSVSLSIVKVVPHSHAQRPV